MNYREYMRECVKDPQSRAKCYGEWGILNAKQRYMIRRLLDEMDSADYIIEELYKENQELKEKTQWFQGIPLLKEIDNMTEDEINKHISRLD